MLLINKPCQFDTLYSGGDIVVSRTYAYGDVVLATALIYTLRQLYGDVVGLRTTPELRELFLISQYPVYYDSSDINAQVLINLDDPVEQLSDRIDKNINRIALMHTYLGLEPSILRPVLDITDSEVGSCKQDGICIGVAPFSRVMAKVFPLDLWTKIIHKLSKDFKVYIFGSYVKGCESLLGDNIFPQWHCSLRGQVLRCANMDLMLTHDSLWSHIAGGVMTPQILFSSCTNGESIIKGYSGSVAVSPNIGCYPCWYVFEKGCGRDDYPYCMSGYSEDMIVNLIMEVING